MSISVLIPAYGEPSWEGLAWNRAFPSARSQCEDVNVFYDPDGTIASVRNELASTARGDWLLFLDADDELAPGYLDAMERAVERASGGVCLLTPAVSYVRKQKPERPKFWPEVDFQSGNWLIIGTLVQKSLFNKVGGFRDFPHGLEDYNFWARCVRAGATIQKVRDAIYLAHWNQESKHQKLSQNRPNYMVEYEAARSDAWG